MWPVKLWKWGILHDDGYNKATRVGVPMVVVVVVVLLVVVVVIEAKGSAGCLCCSSGSR